jgi:hypothetical protein
MDPFVLETIKKNKLSNRLHNLQRSSKPNLIVINSVKTGDNEIIYSSHHQTNNNLMNYTNISTKNNNNNNHSSNNNNNNRESSLKRSKGSPSRITSSNDSLTKSQPSPTIIRHNFNENQNNQNKKFTEEKDIKIVRVENHMESKGEMTNPDKSIELAASIANEIIPTVHVQKHIIENEKEKINIEEPTIIKKDIKPLYNTMAAAPNYNILNHIVDSTNTITYKSSYFMLMTFTLFMFTLLPIQYHNESFGIQMKRMQDQCDDSALNQINNQPSNNSSNNLNQSYILEKLFPFILNARSIKTNDDINKMYNETIRNELSYLIDELVANQKKNNFNNMTIKYLTQKECYLNNFTKILNIIALKPTVLTTQTKRANLMKANFDMLMDENDHYESIDGFTIPKINTAINNHIKKREYFHNDDNYNNNNNNNFEIYEKSMNADTNIINKNPNELVLTNSILICDDELYRKNLFLDKKSANLVNSDEYIDSLSLGSTHDQSNNDFQANILTQVYFKIILISYDYLFK